MRRVTQQLFQLFLTIFIIYAMLYDFPKGILWVPLHQNLILQLHQNLFVSLLCLVCMFLIGKGMKAPDREVDIPIYREPNVSVVLNSKRGQLHIDKEKREHVRIPADIPAELSAQGFLYQGRIKNINKRGWIRIGNVKKGGVFVETQKAFLVGQEILISFWKKNRPGKIVRATPHGIGVKFQRF